MKIEALKFIEKLGLDEILKKRREVVPVVQFKTKEEEINENIRFDYYVVSPDADNFSGNRWNSAIFLFHGLNERSWDKYKPWAETLAN